MSTILSPSLAESSALDTRSGRSGLSASRRDVLAGLASLTALTGTSPVLAEAIAAADPVPTTWDLSALYRSPAEWESARVAALAAIAGLARREGTLAVAPASLADLLRTVSQTSLVVARVQTYARLSNDSTASPENQNRQDLALGLGAKLDEATAWVKPEIRRLGEAKLRGLLARESALAPFRFGLEEIWRRAAHAPDAKIAAMLAAAAIPIGGPSEIFQQLSSISPPPTDLTLDDGHRIRVDARNLHVAARAPDPAYRERYFDAYWTAFGTVEAVFGANLQASIQGDVFKARALGYAGSLEAALDGPNIPAAVYRTALAEADAGLPVLHRYYDLRRKMLALPTFRLSDKSVPATRYDRRFTLNEMRSAMLAAVAPLGDAYVDRLANATMARWMDPYPRPGKVVRNYTDPDAYDIHPYQLLNLSDGYVDLTMFTHEWGHAMHSVLANAAQPYETSQYPVLTAEVASTCNEQLLVEHMIATSSTRPETLFYLFQKMQGLSIIFFNNAMMARFESRSHDVVEAGGSLSGESLTEDYLALLKRYYGPAVTIETPYAREWMRVPHFYDAFYNWQYVPCIAAAVHFSARIRKGDASDRERYLGVLRAGGSDYGYDILRNAGIDLADPVPYRELVRDFAHTIDRAEALI